MKGYSASISHYTAIVDANEKTNSLINNKTVSPKNKYDRHEPTTTTILQNPDLGQANTECGGVKHVRKNIKIRHIVQYQELPKARSKS